MFQVRDISPYYRNQVHHFDIDNKQDVSLNDELANQLMDLNQDCDQLQMIEEFVQTVLMQMYNVQMSEGHLVIRMQKTRKNKKISKIKQERFF